jgi:hypothetical protein
LNFYAILEDGYWIRLRARHLKCELAVAISFKDHKCRSITRKAATFRLDELTEIGRSLTRRELKSCDLANHPNKDILIRTKHQIIVGCDVPGLNARRQPAASSHPRTSGGGEAHTKQGIAAGKHGFYLSIILQPSES